jgi:hypothetical protein
MREQFRVSVENSGEPWRGVEFGSNAAKALQYVRELINDPSASRIVFTARYILDREEESNEKVH